MAVERDRRRDRTGRRAAARQQSQPHEAERRTKENDKIRRVTSARARSVEKEFLAYSAPPSRDRILDTPTEGAPTALPSEAALYYVGQYCEFQEAARQVDVVSSSLVRQLACEVASYSIDAELPSCLSPTKGHNRFNGIKHTSHRECVIPV